MMVRAPVRAKTPWFIAHVMNPIMKMTGTFPILTLRGWRTGRTLQTPINVLDLNGMLYLVSPRGETGWSRNLREVRECSLKIKGRQTRYRAAEVPPAERGPIINGYLAKWGNQTRSQFEALPDPSDHPTFRLEPV